MGLCRLREEARFRLVANVEERECTLVGVVVDVDVGHLEHLHAVSIGARTGIVPFFVAVVTFDALVCFSVGTGY